MLAHAISISGLATSDAAPWAGGPRRAIEWAAGTGARAVQLDATMAGLRPRDLDRSARRDLCSLLRRVGIGCAGVDLWIPASHFADATRVDRATSAVAQAVEFAGEVDRIMRESAGQSGNRSGAVVAIALPAKPLAGVERQIRDHAERHGVVVADHAWPPREGTGRLPAGIDPAAIIFAGDAPDRAVIRLPEAPAAARLSDLSPAGRVVPGSGEGKLDPMAYEVALVTRGYVGWIVADVRGLPDQDAAARSMVAAR